MKQTPLYPHPIDDWLYVDGHPWIRAVCRIDEFDAALERWNAAEVRP